MLRSMHSLQLGYLALAASIMFEAYRRWSRSVPVGEIRQLLAL
jgi:hypothetical protein